MFPPLRELLFEMTCQTTGMGELAAVVKSPPLEVIVKKKVGLEGSLGDGNVFVRLESSTSTCAIVVDGPGEDRARKEKERSSESDKHCK